MGQRVGLGHMLRLGADNDRKFNFPIGFLGILGDDDRVVGAGGRAEFAKQDRVIGHVHASFCRVVRVIQPDTQNTTYVIDHRGKPARDDRQGRNVHIAQLVQRCGCHRGKLDIRQMLRQIARGTIYVNHRRFYPVRGFDTAEFH